MSIEPSSESSHFIADRILADQASGRHHGQVMTRFPPEPNGYLHIGHAKSICLNFGLASQFQGKCNLRFDDTNPTTENDEYVQAIQKDVQWLGFEWDALFFASDYFDQIYAWAEQLILDGKAYIDESTPEEMADYRGNFNRSGRPTPYRDRSIDENLSLFRKMRDGGFDEGKAVLRAKIDVTHPNMNMRDPVLYRVKKAHHHRTGDKWCIYPMYDYAHPLSDAIEKITHSICTLEFEDHRPFYDWCIQNIDTGGQPEQIEFARLNLTYTVMSKRKLLQLVNERRVEGWDDPRMLTISGLRRRGVTPSAIREFARLIGISKANSWIDMSVFEGCIRDDLDATAPRAMAVLRPIQITLSNFQPFTAVLHNHPKNAELGQRNISLTQKLYIEADDFAEQPPKGFFRLVPGGWVRLRGAGFVRCDNIVRDASGAVCELICTWHPPTEGKEGPEGLKVKGTIHWVPENAPNAKVCLYDRLFSVEHPDSEDWITHINPNSREILEHARVEPLLASAASGASYQFERLGFFCADTLESRPGAPVWNRVVTLKDSWVKAK